MGVGKRLRLKRKGIANDRASLCKPLKHSALYFALANIVIVDRTMVVFELFLAVLSTVGH